MFVLWVNGSLISALAVSGMCVAEICDFDRYSETSRMGSTRPTLKRYHWPVSFQFTVADRCHPVHSDRIDRHTHYIRSHQINLSVSCVRLIGKLPNPRRLNLQQHVAQISNHRACPTAIDKHLCDHSETPETIIYVIPIWNMPMNVVVCLDLTCVCVCVPVYNNGMPNSHYSDGQSNLRTHAL